MREILFRAKTTKKISPIHEFNEKWVEGNLIKSDGKYYIHPLCNRVKMAGELGKIIIMHEVQPDTICQYTGLNDKNGCRIFEGDILEAHWDSDYPDDAVLHKVIWSENGFQSIENDSVDNHYLMKVDCDEYFEVVGNTFDNPELL